MRLQTITNARSRLFAPVAAATVCLLALTTQVGAANSATLVRDINPTGSSNPRSMVQVGSTVFFAADDGTHGMELWKSNGTATGTKLVKNIRPLGKSSYPDYLTAFKGTLYFMADDGTHGQELWRSDGTKAGTKMVKDIHTGPNGQFGGNSTMLRQAPIVMGNRMFLIVDSCCVGTSDIFVSDGTAAGTLPVTWDLEEPLTLPDEGRAYPYNGKVYFVNYTLEDDNCIDCDSENQLWSSDGTAAGTHRVAGTPGDDLEMGILPASGQSLYFYAADRLWKTDGTAAGTKPLTVAYQLESMPTEAAYLNDRLYFSTAAIDGAGLWKTNGTAAGTTEILDGSADWLTVAGGRLYFVHNRGLWTTDGTLSGTHQVASFGEQFPIGLIRVADKVVFAVPNWDTGAWTLWKSDGSTVRTTAVKQFVDAFEREWQPLGTAVGSRLYFAADDGTHGSELWSYTP